ncbi:twin transmembrane helix small protein [Paragemmobacter straminiformis]|uniref:Twin transmembrane helix small protein n=1 Tax=Paragemmobacter straminiformis TaxID=2045119 RepID=A0A842IBH1_9RHOB|nr:twin transmembrane helix small protein [Gemmobacter straminiformis]MBC2836926.1 twin transmembrane helix small protein [Gemmobacter straminiformis]
MSGDPLFILASVSALVVLAILMFGIGSFAKGGEFNRRNANKLMRYRIIAQAVAVAVIVAFAYFHGGR